MNIIVSRQQIGPSNHVIIGFPIFDLFLNPFKERVEVIKLTLKECLALKIDMRCSGLPDIFGNEINHEIQTIFAREGNELGLHLERNPSPLSIASYVGAAFGMMSSTPSPNRSETRRHEGKEANDAARNGSVSLPVRIARLIDRCLNGNGSAVRLAAIFAYTLLLGILAFIGVARLWSQRCGGFSLLVFGAAFSLAPLAVLLLIQSG